MPPLPRPSPEQEKLRKQISEYTQYQWLSLMPAWMPGALSALNHTKTAPGREGIVAAFDLGMIVFGIVCFILVRGRISSMKKRLAQLELQTSPPVSPLTAPPIAKP